MGEWLDSQTGPDKWVDRLTNRELGGLTYGKIDRRVGGCLDRQTDMYLDSEANRQVDVLKCREIDWTKYRQTDSRMDIQAEGLVNKQTYVCMWMNGLHTHTHTHTHVVSGF